MLHTKLLYMQTIKLLGSSGILNFTLHWNYLGKDCAVACNQMEGWWWEVMQSKGWAGSWVHFLINCKGLQ